MTAITSILIFIGFFTLLLLEPKADFMNLLLRLFQRHVQWVSRGITPDLHNGSLFILSLLMFAGRLGPLTLAYLIATPKRVDSNILKPIFKLIIKSRFKSGFSYSLSTNSRAIHPNQHKLLDGYNQSSFHHNH